MKIILFTLLLLLSVIAPKAIAQEVVFEKSNHDFGDLEAGDARYIDIYLKNKTDKEAYILSIDQPREVVYIQKKALILPDSTNVLRFQINKKTKGRFNYKFDVYTSDKTTPTQITLKGRILSISSNQNNFTACPSFGQEPANQNPMDFTLTVRTVDKNTGERLSNSIVAILQGGSALGKWKTNSRGQFKIKIPLGISYFYATHKGYYPAEKGLYVNFKRNLVILELEPKEEEPEVSNEPITEIPKEDTTFVAEVDEETEEIDLTDVIEENDSIAELSEEVPPAFSELDENDFSEDNFKPINVVFVIDVSSSMRQEDRIELLKYSLSQLVAMLRPQDKIGLVSYANDAQVLLKPTSGDEKEQINKIVKDLKASGATAGGKGIKIGYRQARRNFISDGANKVIIITDGAFNRSSGDYQKYIKRNLKRCVTLSVVGIKSNERSEENMREAAELGKGRFIMIEKLADAQSRLKQEIRLTTFKH
jgi:Ca-activated chloride channel family protein